MPHPNASRDLSAECMAEVSQKSGERVTLTVLAETFCVYCRNPDCVRAMWAEDRWTARMMTQEDRLLNNPTFSDLVLPSHLAIHELDWEDMRRQAMKLEISAQRGDWEPVSDEDVDPTDGVSIVSTEGATNAVDEALKMLAKKRGKKPPQLPKLTTGIEDPTQPSPTESEMVEEQAKVERKRNPRQMTPQQRAAAARMMGIDMPQEAPQEQETQPAQEVPQEAEQQPPPQPPQESPRQPPPVQMGNTPPPSNQGIMVDGSEPPRNAPKRTPAADPWAPKPKERIVKPGARIKMGGGKKND